MSLPETVKGFRTSDPLDDMFLQAIAAAEETRRFARDPQLLTVLLWCSLDDATQYAGGEKRFKRQEKMPCHLIAVGRKDFPQRLTDWFDVKDRDNLDKPSDGFTPLLKGILVRRLPQK